MYVEILPVRIAGDANFTTNCYVVSDTPEDSCVLVIDPGDEAKLIAEHLAEKSVAAIVITHGHYDHIGGVTELAGLTGAPIYAHEREAELISENFDKIRRGYSIYARVKATGAEPDAADPGATAPQVSTLLTDGETVELCGLSFKVLHTPGHSPGSICLYSAADGVLFSGDTLFKGTCGRTDFEGGSSKAMHDSLALLATLPPETVVYPGHNEPTTIQDELYRGLREY